MSLSYHQIMWAEMKPDMYAGEKCDKVRPLFECSTEGDMESELNEILILNAKHFPPGTKIVVMEPECPKCNMVPELCKTDNGCDFNWEKWRDNQYS